MTAVRETDLLARSKHQLHLETAAERDDRSVKGFESLDGAMLNATVRTGPLLLSWKLCAEYSEVTKSMSLPARDLIGYLLVSEKRFRKTCGAEFGIDEGGFGTFWLEG